MTWYCWEQVYTEREAERERLLVGSGNLIGHESMPLLWDEAIGELREAHAWVK
jgi:hypothetical protein